MDADPGAYWRTLGISLLAYVAVSVLASIVVYPFSAITTFFITNTFAVLALTAVAQVISSVVTTIFIAGVVSLLYIDVRMRREGLDVELTAAANEHGRRDRDARRVPRRLAGAAARHLPSTSRSSPTRTPRDAGCRKSSSTPSTRSSRPS
ncbi:hypothetical protein NKG05_21325 [Oerskovia sp. M15]